MKIFGSRSSGRRVANRDNTHASTRISGTPARAGARSGTGTAGGAVNPSAANPGARTAKSKRASGTGGATVVSRKSKRNKRLIIAGSVILFVASAIMLVFFSPLWDVFFRPGEDVLARPDIPPPIVDPTAPERPPILPDDGPDHDGDSDYVVPPIEELRSVDKFTFLVLGIDGTANTDAIMVASFDTEEHTLEIVNIPRDTMVNVSWNVRKVNSIQAVMRNRYRNESNAEERAMQATVEHFSNLLGFHVDFWVTINMRGFINLIDAIGGVYFDVPVNINWNDPVANLSFQLPRGYQRVNGNNALGLMRWRGYAQGDLARINVQQDFLLAAAQQLLAGVSVGALPTFIETFLSHVRTDLQMNHLAWIGRELLNVAVEDINFTTMPGNIDFVRGGSYITLILDEWLEIVNNQLSPLHNEITADDVSILTRGPDRRLFVTDGNWQGTPWN